MQFRRRRPASASAPVSASVSASVSDLVALATSKQPPLPLLDTFTPQPLCHLLDPFCVRVGTRQHFLEVDAPGGEARCSVKDVLADAEVLAEVVVRRVVGGDEGDGRV